MITAGIRRLLTRLASPALAGDKGPTNPVDTFPRPQQEFALYCQAQPGFAERYMGAQTAHNILTRGFLDRYYRFHARTNGWIAPTEWIEGSGVHLADRPADPAGLVGVQIEVLLALPERALTRYEMVRSDTVGIDYTGACYRRNREFLIPARLLNSWGLVRVLPDEETWGKCPFCIAEAQARAERLTSMQAMSQQAAHQQATNMQAAA